MISGCKHAFGDRHVRTFRASNDLSSVYARQGRQAEAEKRYLETANALEDGHPVPLDAVYAEATFQLACLAANRSDRSAAMTWLRKSVDAGLPMPDRIASVPDLTHLHGSEFDALVERALGH